MGINFFVFFNLAIYLGVANVHCDDSVC